MNNEKKAKIKFSILILLLRERERKKVYLVCGHMRDKMVKADNLLQKSYLQMLINHAKNCK